jgi:hypothetical protein
LIQVVIPHIEVEGPHSREATLAQAIDSVYTQTVSEFIHKPIVITDTERRGPAWAVAQGVAQVKTKWVTLLGDDDWLMPRHHQTLMYWAEQTGADVVYGEPIIGDGTTLQPGGIWDMTFDEERLRKGNYIPGGGSLIRTSLLKEVGVPQMDSIRYEREMAVYEDWAMYIALLDGGAKFHHVKQGLYYMRRWAGGGKGRDFRRDGTLG